MPSPGPPADLEFLAQALDGAWMLLCSFFVLFRHVGLALMEAGCVQEKHVVRVFSQKIMVLLVGSVGWLLVGCSIAQGKSLLEVNIDDDEQAHWLFSMLLCTTMVSIATGNLAERIRTSACAVICLAFAVVIYPLPARWAWGHGWLSTELQPAFHDFAGGAVVHLAGGVSAAVGARILGPRYAKVGSRVVSRFDCPASQACRAKFMPQRVPSVLIGTVVLWFAGYGLNVGATNGMRTRAQALAAGRAAVNTTLAAVSGGLTALALRMDIWQRAVDRVMKRRRKPQVRMPHYDAVACCLGILSGLVSIAAGCDCVTNSAAFVVGVLGTLSSWLGAAALRALRVDDLLEASAVHSFAGATGVIAVGLFHRQQGLFVGGGLALLGTQLQGVLAVAATAALASGVLFGALSLAGVLKVREHQQEGLDSIEALQELEMILVRAGVSLEDALVALDTLRGVIWRPFSPQAGSHKIGGEVLDICGLMSYDVKAGDTYLGFISHYKAEGGDAARIIYDRMSAAVLEDVGISEDRSPRSCAGRRTRRQVRAASEPERCNPTEVAAKILSSYVDSVEQRVATCPTLVIPDEDLEAAEAADNVSIGASPAPLQSQAAARPQPPRLPPGCMNRGISTNSEPGDHVQHEDSEQRIYTSISTTSSTRLHEQCVPGDHEASRALRLKNSLTGLGPLDGPQIRPSKLLFLDSCELRDLNDLLCAVRRSENFIILLTRGVLTRPWVLAELSVAVQERKNILAVRIEWPSKDDDKHFSFPECIDEIAFQLELYQAERQHNTAHVWSPTVVRGVANMLSRSSSRSSRSAPSGDHGPALGPDAQVAPRTPPSPSRLEAQALPRTPQSSSRFGLGFLGGRAQEDGLAELT